MKNILVLGCGRFGRRVVESLAQGRGVRVFALDLDEPAVERIADKVHTAAVGDLNDPDALRDFLAETGPLSAAVVSLGDEINASILAAMQLRDAGVPRIIIKAVNEGHRRVLTTLDESVSEEKVFQVILPEQDAAERAARMLGSELVESEIPLAEGIHLLEVNCPAAFAGKTLADLQLRKRLQVIVVGYRILAQDGQPETRRIHLPHPEAEIPAGSRVSLIGRTEDLQAFVREYGG